MRQIYVLSLSVVYIHCDGRCNACNAVGSAASCISIGGMDCSHKFEWQPKLQNFNGVSKFTEKNQEHSVGKCQQNWMFYHKMQHNHSHCSVHWAALEVFNFSTRIPYFLVCSCEQKIQKRWLSESRVRYLLMWELVRKVWHAARLRASQGKQNVLQKWQENQCDFFRLLQYSRRTRQ